VPRSRLKRLWREFRYLIGPAALEASVALTRIIPLPFTLLLMEDLLGRIAWPLAGPYRGQMRENLRLSLGEIPEEERDRIAKEALRNMFRGFVELFYSVHCFDRLSPHLRWRGEEHLKEALAQGRGVIAVTAHLGNFTLMGVAMARRGYPFRMIIKDPKHPRMARTFQKMRRQQGTPWIPAVPPMRCQREILRALKRGEVVGFVADENRRRGGIVMEFLGRKMAMPPGPAFYHIATGAPILPVFLLRGQRGLEMVIKPPLEVSLSGDRDRDLYLITKTVTQEIEGMIRRHPEQWHWVSRTRVKIRARRRAFEEIDKS